MQLKETGQLLQPILMSLQLLDYRSPDTELRNQLNCMRTLLEEVVGQGIWYGMPLQELAQSFLQLTVSLLEQLEQS